MFSYFPPAHADKCTLPIVQLILERDETQYSALRPFTVVILSARVFLFYSRVQNVCSQRGDGLPGGRLPCDLLATLRPRLRGHGRHHSQRPQQGR